MRRSLLVLAAALLVLPGCFTASSDIAGIPTPDAASEGPDAAEPGPDAASTPDASSGSADAATADGGSPDAGPPPYPGFKTGDRCASNLDCKPQVGGGCLDDSKGFPNGYCTGVCHTSIPTSCDPGTFCVDFTPGDAQDNGACFKGCAVDGDCRANYLCDDRVNGVSLAQKACLPGNRAGKLGDPCKGFADCNAGDTCLAESTPNLPLPGGYCTHGCNTANLSACSPNGVCHDFEPNDAKSTGACLKGCTADSECRNGYVCDSSFSGQAVSGKACVPGTRATVAIGDPCVNGGGCMISQFCLTAAAGYSNGYCSATCSTSSDCGGDARCLFADPAASKKGLCFDGCAQTSDCRGKYGCSNRISGVAIAPAQVCIPFDSAAKIGSACTAYGNCTLGGLCIQETNEKGLPSGFGGGYCSDTCVATPADSCPTGAFCIAAGGQNLCVAGCSTASDCRASSGYRCKKPTLQSTQTACWPF